MTWHIILNGTEIWISKTVKNRMVQLQKQEIKLKYSIVTRVIANGRA